MNDIKRFKLIRDTDESGVSGTGHVADGVVFWNGKCAVSWRTQHTSVAVYDDIETVEAIHGHNGQTRVVFDNSQKLRESIEAKEETLRDKLKALVETWRSRTTSTYWCGICLERMADDLECVLGGEE